MTKAEARAAYEALMKFYPLTLEDLGGELWKWIPSYEGRYQVSTFGRVKSFKRKRTLILKPLWGSMGYLRVDLCKNGLAKHFFVHRLVAQAFIPNSKGKCEVNHLDGHPLNCHVSNLEWVTTSENVRHAVLLGLKKSGEDSHNAKLTNEQARYIRNNPDGLALATLAERLGVNQSAIERIQRGRTYKGAGGVVRGKMRGGRPRISDDVRNEIRQLFIKGDSEFGARALARRYCVSHRVILQIINEK